MKTLGLLIVILSLSSPALARHHHGSSNPAPQQNPKTAPAPAPAPVPVVTNPTPAPVPVVVALPPAPAPQPAPVVVASPAPVPSSGQTIVSNFSVEVDDPLVSTFCYTLCDLSTTVACAPGSACDASLSSFPANDVALFAAGKPISTLFGELTAMPANVQITAAAYPLPENMVFEIQDSKGTILSSMKTAGYTGYLPFGVNAIDSSFSLVVGTIDASGAITVIQRLPFNITP